MRNGSIQFGAGGVAGRRRVAGYARPSAPGPSLGEQVGNLFLAGGHVPRRYVIGAILVVALFAFEIFNFDTTRYALANLLGDVSFLGLRWAAILAVAFCSIDFAGLVRLMTPDKGQGLPREVWYLMGAWLLGATMNALMTWWAVSLVLLSHDFGNEVLSRDQLLHIVPIFVAVLVWLTRILFIGAFTVAGNHIFNFAAEEAVAGREQSLYASAARPAPGRRPSVGMPEPAFEPVSEEVPGFLNGRRPAQGKQPATTPGFRPEPANQPAPPAESKRTRHERVQQRPPVPNGVQRVPTVGVQARSRDGRR